MFGGLALHFVATDLVWLTVNITASQQCCGSGMFILDPNFFYLEFQYFIPQKWFLSTRKYDPGCSSRIPDPDPDFLPIPDPNPQHCQPAGEGGGRVGIQRSLVRHRTYFCSETSHEGFPVPQNLKIFLSFFPFLDQDPDSLFGSGSIEPVEFGSETVASWDVKTITMTSDSVLSTGSGIKNATDCRICLTNFLFGFANENKVSTAVFRICDILVRIRISD